jgi:hypothetical protein
MQVFAKENVTFQLIQTKTLLPIVVQIVKTHVNNVHPQQTVLPVSLESITTHVITVVRLPVPIKL